MLRKQIFSKKNLSKIKFSESFFDFQIAITFEPKVVDPYNLGDSWSVDQDLSSGKLVPYSGGGGSLLGGIEEKLNLTF